MKKQIVIFGPTAVGKTTIAAKLANEFNGEIISADSRQVYKMMDIGTGKDLSDYFVNGHKINYHLIDICEPFEEFNLARFIEEYNKAASEIVLKNKIPFLVGGTMLYVSSVINGYKLKKVDFEKERVAYERLSTEELKRKILGISKNLHNTTDLTDRNRIIKALIIAREKENETIEPIKFNNLNICIFPERKKIYEQIDKRLSFRLENGMIDEVKNLIEYGLTFEKLDFFGLEYRFIGKYLNGEINFNDMKQKLSSAIKKFAKRQITWIRKIEKSGVPVHYFNSPGEFENISQKIREFLSDR